MTMVVTIPTIGRILIGLVVVLASIGVLGIVVDASILAGAVASAVPVQTTIGSAIVLIVCGWIVGTVLCNCNSNERGWWRT